MMLLSFLWILGLFIFSYIPTCRKSSSKNLPFPSVSIIIPARNEERNLPNLLRSLNRQSYKAGEIIVVDDHSTDRTSDVSRSFGAQLINSKALPEGWVGKTWACHQGAKYARGECLIFLDADTVLEPDGLEKILHTYLEVGGILSIQPYHQTIKPYEELSSFFNLVTTGATNSINIFGVKTKNPSLFGPSLIISQKDYKRIGGHESVKDKILENLHLAAHATKKHISANGYAGFGTLQFRMYPNGVLELIEGWSKAFATGATKTHWLRLVLIIAWISGCMTSVQVIIRSWITMSLSQLTVPLLFYLAYAGQIVWILRRIGNFKLYTALLFPIPLLFFFYVFIRSIFMVYVLKKVKWKERAIAR